MISPPALFARAVFQHNPGICAEGNASLEKRTLKFTCQGVWPVSFIPGCFELHLNKPLNLNTLIRDYIKKPWDSGAPLSAETYGALLQVMQERDLRIEMDVWQNYVRDATQYIDYIYFYSDGKALRFGKHPHKFFLDGTVMLGYRGDGGDLVIPEEVTAIGRADEFDDGCCFRPLHPITSIAMSDNVEKIDCRFQIPNDHLYKITLSKNLKELSCAFAHCGQLREISIPDGVTNLEERTFYRCRSLNTVRLPGKLEEIGEYAFSQCGSLRGVKLPASLRKIGVRAFRSCKSIEEITIPDGVETLEKETFAGCSKLENVTLPASVKKMTKGVFKDCAAGLTLHAPAGSYAEEFAKKNKIKFEALP